MAHNVLEIQLRKLGLTNKEVEVALLVARGLTNSEASDQLGMSVKTVKFHLTSVFKKLGIKSRANLIVACSKYENPPKLPFARTHQKHLA